MILYVISAIIIYLYGSDWIIKDTPKSFVLFWLDVEIYSVILWFIYMMFNIKFDMFKEHIEIHKTETL